MKHTTGISELYDPAPRGDSFVHGARPCGALDHPLRREICILLRSREVGATELAAALACHPPTLSHHLAMLLAAGLVSVRAEGRRRFYRVEPAAALASWELYLEPGRARPAVRDQRPIAGTDAA